MMQRNAVSPMQGLQACRDLLLDAVERTLEIMRVCIALLFAEPLDPDLPRRIDQDANVDLLTCSLEIPQLSLTPLPLF